MIIKSGVMRQMKGKRRWLSFPLFTSSPVFRFVTVSLILTSTLAPCLSVLLLFFTLFCLLSRVHQCPSGTEILPFLPVADVPVVVVVQTENRKKHKEKERRPAKHK